MAAQVLLIVIDILVLAVTAGLGGAEGDGSLPRRS